MALELRESSDTTRMLEKLDFDMRGVTVRRALQSAGRVVIKRAKQIVPQPGYEGDDPTKKPLRDTIGMVFREYEFSRVQLVVVGPMYPAGAHGHLVEHGHKAVDGSWVPGKEFMAPAVDQTRSEQHARVVATIKRAMERAK